MVSQQTKCVSTVQLPIQMERERDQDLFKNALSGYRLSPLKKTSAKRTNASLPQYLPSKYHKNGTIWIMQLSVLHPNDKIRAETSCVSVAEPPIH